MCSISSGRGFLAVVITHTAIASSYVTFVVRSSLLQLDKTIEEAALDLGATPNTIFFSITLPIIFPSLLSSWLLAFVISLDDVVLASFVSGPEIITLPMFIFSKMRFGITPEISALSFIMIIFVTTCILLSYFLTKIGNNKSYNKNYKKSKKEGE